MSSLGIATVLLCLAAGVGVASLAARSLRDLLYPAGATYAAFRPERGTAECEITCEGATEHEDEGDGTATCTGCGTPCRSPAPDPA
ncbi:hypothetical protein [Streptomyces neyagawaensis]|uniref:hypothetical protein n=1 Tax=Streptomyces neyagawaensis TaxID=42238 RepID=UPI0006E37BE9|nr:hypothetical protein [Streptomyces neyagawaensis]MCL6733332.1 hypothetical protein [Streptomyces neyagawaensis]MDE1685136.1 hypothetical protein [Streptomyces neyagawaensis]